MEFKVSNALSTFLLVLSCYSFFVEAWILWTGSFGKTESWWIYILSVDTTDWNPTVSV